MRSSQFIQVLLVGATLIRASMSAQANTTQGDVEFFEKKIRPALAEHCYECHSEASKKLKGGLHLDSRPGLLRGGETGPAIVPGKPEQSLLITAITHRQPDLAMPARKPRLPAPVIADFEKWVRDGAAWPEDGGSKTATPAGPAPAKPRGFDLADRKQQLGWIWQTPKRPAIPHVTDPGWSQQPVDRFIRDRLQKEGIDPAPLAEPRVWLRRVYFALTGLPPSPEELTEFLGDSSPEARARVVDQLLASPQYGERWGRHWLDLMRYAESRGHEGDYVIPNAFEYRDYVVRALNADVPYDAFVREHLAGDLLSQPRRHPQKGFNESILGTGWAFLGEEIHAPVDTRLDETERVDNRIDVMSKTFLGLTVSCARCHDHKFDAISQRDYYALAGFFISSGQRLARFETMEQEQAVAPHLAQLDRRWKDRLASKLAEAQRPVLSDLKGYLLAAAEAAQAGPRTPLQSGQRHHPTNFPPAVAQAIKTISAKQDLQPAVLGQWTAVVLNAASDTNDLFFPFASVAVSKAAPEPEATPGKGPELSLPPGARVVIDFAKLAPGDWHEDGVGFGPGPVQPGELEVGCVAPPETPPIRFASRPAARTIAAWNRLGVSPGVEREPTMYGSWKRDGIMLRTPKFELKQGKLFYLVRGSGRVLAAVDSQRLVTGPIHTVLPREWGFQEQWHWVGHDLSDYQGHRVALEFSPGNEFDTAIAMVVESAQAPSAPATPRSWMSRELAGRHPQSAADLAAGYQKILSGASLLRPGQEASSEAWQVASWLALHPELFSGRPGAWPEPMAAQLTAFVQEREKLLSGLKWQSRTAPAMMEGNGVDEYLLVRGKHHTPKGLVPRRFLEAVSGPEGIKATQNSGRLELARIMTDPTNPLTARVFVNRVWHHLFGRGIVATVDNFGWLGQRPTHPELLDYLADSFIREDEWSLKRLLRRLVLSRTYASSSKPADPRAEERDPENLLLHRMNLKRLEGEAIRDAILSVSGRLNRRMFGASVPLHPSQFVEARGLRSERGPLDGDGRRSIYVAARRNFFPMMMSAFDTPTPFTTVGRRNVSNVPGQMLFLMNDPFVHQQAAVWARRVESELPNAGAEERIRRIFLASLSREPSAPELQDCLATLRETELISKKSKDTFDPWTELCHALIGVKEFIFIR